MGRFRDMNRELRGRMDPRAAEDPEFRKMQRAMTATGILLPLVAVVALFHGALLLALWAVWASLPGLVMTYMLLVRRFVPLPEHSAEERQPSLK